MKTATVEVIRAIYVPASEHLDGVTLAEPAWAQVGVHHLNEEFARDQEQRGMLEITEVDGKPYVWSACCSGGDHDHDEVQQ